VAFISAAPAALTAGGAAVRIEGMWRQVSLALSLVVALGNGGSAAFAQLELATKPYVPPPAWKSVEIGNFYLKGKKYRAALSRFQEAVNTDPYYAQGYLGLGQVYERIGLKQKALTAYQQYLDLLPSAKEAAEAKNVHHSIARLENDLKRRGDSTTSKPRGEDKPSPPE
jgi:tetratricopeptide (TPR) repeat protein